MEISDGERLELDASIEAQTIELGGRERTRKPVKLASG